jgi:hypothetical protein
VNLRNALQAEEARIADLRNALQTEQTRVALLHSVLQAEQGQVANLNNIVQTEQANAGYIMGRIQQLEAELVAQSQYRGVFGSIREIGDRMTGGGLRSLAKRTRGLGDRMTGGGLRNLAKRVLLVLGRAVLKPFPKLTTSLCRLTTTPDAVAMPSVVSVSGASPPDASATKLVPSDGNQQLATLPASARSMYQKLRAAMSDSNAWNQNR